MTWVAAAVVGSAAIGYIGSQQASRAQRSAANQASQVAGQISDAQAALQREQFNKQLELGAPYREAGLTGQNRLMALLGLQAPTTFGPQTPWNEGAYRAANPDVAAAVERGEFANAKQHYDMFGREEGRNLGFSPTAATAAGGQRPADFGKYATAEFGGVKGFDPASLMQGFTAQDFQADPGYAFRMAEGMKALERSAAARGGLLSGATLRGTQRFGQDLASQEYQNAFNRFQANRATQGQEYANAFNRFQAERANTLSPLQSLAGQGQAGAQQAAQASQAYTTGAGNALGAYGSAVQGNLIGAGNAQASGYMGGANALAGGLGQGINFYQNQQLMNRFFPPTPTGPTLLAGG
jgi:hypothetical protein